MINTAALACMGDRGLPGPLHTVRSKLGVHVVTAICRHCNHAATLDLPALMQAGQADVALVELPLRRSQCGRRGHTIIVSGKPFSLGQ